MNNWEFEKIWIPVHVIPTSPVIHNTFKHSPDMSEMYSISEYTLLYSRFLLLYSFWPQIWCSGYSSLHLKLKIDSHITIARIVYIRDTFGERTGSHWKWLRTISLKPKALAAIKVSILQQKTWYRFEVWVHIDCKVLCDSRVSYPDISSYSSKYQYNNTSRVLRLKWEKIDTGA